MRGMINLSILQWGVIVWILLAACSMLLFQDKRGRFNISMGLGVMALAAVFVAFFEAIIRLLGGD